MGCAVQTPPRVAPLHVLCPPPRAYAQLLSLYPPPSPPPPAYPQYETGVSGNRFIGGTDGARGFFSAGWVDVTEKGWKEHETGRASVHRDRGSPSEHAAPAGRLPLASSLEASPWQGPGLAPAPPRGHTWRLCLGSSHISITSPWAPGPRSTRLPTPPPLANHTGATLGSGSFSTSSPPQQRPSCPAPSPSAPSWRPTLSTPP